MNKKLPFAIAFFVSILTPFVTYAASFKDIVNNTIVPFGNTVASVIYALAFLFFLIGMVRFYLSPSEEARQKGKMFAIWGIIGLAVMFGVWGLVKILINLPGQFGLVSS